MQDQRQEFHHSDLLISCPLSTVTSLLLHLDYSFFILVSFFLQDFLKTSKEQIDILVSRRYSAASNSKRQVEVRYNSYLSQTYIYFKPVILITK